MRPLPLKPDLDRPTLAAIAPPALENTDSAISTLVHPTPSTPRIRLLEFATPVALDYLDFTSLSATRSL
jgi:hypothetical protein